MSYNPAKASSDLPRIPKLAVRNKFPNNADVTQSQADEPRVISGSSEGISGPRDSHFSQSPWEESGTGEIAVANGSQPERPQSSSAQGVNESTPDAGKNQTSKSKKKNSGVLSFLTLKEPSTKAWEEFAEAEKEKAKQRGSLIPSSSQKLPDHVPKVNSRWDGMPESAKRRSVESRGSDKAKPKESLSTSDRNSNEQDVAPSINKPPEHDFETQRLSTASSARPLSSDQDPSSKPDFSNAAPANVQLGPVAGVSPFPSALNLNRQAKIPSSANDEGELSQEKPDDETEGASPSAATADEAQPSSPTEEYGSDYGAPSPLLGETEERTEPPKIPARNPRRKPINFSRPRPMPAGVLLQPDPSEAKKDEPQPGS